MDLFGIKCRAENRHLRALAASRGERLEEGRKHVMALAAQRSRYKQRHDLLMAAVAHHLANHTTHAQLRAALAADNDTRAELEYALLDHPISTRPAVTP